MIVPQFWAEGRIQHKEQGRQITVRRFGWSDDSMEEAQSRADDRAREALQRILAGEHLARRERKVPYNGADGVPIREEIVTRHGDTVVTRNSYGALCLNTPNVLFADIDLQENSPASLKTGVGIVLCLSFLAYAVIVKSPGWFVAGILAAIFLNPLLSKLTSQNRETAEGGAARQALERIMKFSQQNPEWHLRLYETPAGYRVLVLHDVFDPASPAVGDFFSKLGSDKVYARMCQKQHCFRARVSPKPWPSVFTRACGPGRVYGR